MCDIGNKQFHYLSIVRYSLFEELPGRRTNTLARLMQIQKFTEHLWE